MTHPNFLSQMAGTPSGGGLQTNTSNDLLSNIWERIAAARNSQGQAGPARPAAIQDWPGMAASQANIPPASLSAWRQTADEWPGQWRGVADPNLPPGGQVPQEAGPRRNFWSAPPQQPPQQAGPRQGSWPTSPQQAPQPGTPPMTPEQRRARMMDRWGGFNT